MIYEIKLNALNSIGCVFQVVEYILDRNACLLPAYFAVTEIRKLYPEGKLSHWVCMSFIVCMQQSYMYLKETCLFILHYPCKASWQFNIRLCGQFPAHSQNQLNLW